MAAELPSIAIVGAGITGLTAALRLVEQGHEVHVFEASSRPGGAMGTTEVDGFRFENGPNTISGKSERFLRLCQDLGLSDQVVSTNPVTRDRFLLHNQQIVAAPTSFGGFLRSPLLSLPQKARLLREKWVKPRLEDPDAREESVREFLARRFGRGLAEKWADVLVSGIYGGSADELGIASAFPTLAQMEREHGGVLRGVVARARARRSDPKVSSRPPAMVSLRNGLQSFVDAAAQRLGYRLHLRHTVRSVFPEGGTMRLALEGPHFGDQTLRGDRVILAVPAPIAADLLNRAAPSVSDGLRTIEYASMVVIHGGFPNPELPGLRPGFGLLVPRRAGLRTLGWIYASCAFDGRAPEGHLALNGFLGGVLDPGAIEESDDAIRHLMLTELQTILRLPNPPRPRTFRVVRWPRAIPQYTRGHLQRMDALRRTLQRVIPEVRLAANYTEGVSVESCVAAGERAARWAASGTEVLS